MRRVIVIAAMGLSLAGCSSFSLDVFKPTPPTVQLQLESTPPGADARTSLGPGCKTPCTVAVTVPDNGFSVTYTMIKFQTATIPVQVIHNPGEFFSSPVDDAGSQSRGRGTSAARAAAEAGTQDDAAEKAQKTQGRRSAS